MGCRARTLIAALVAAGYTVLAVSPLATVVLLRPAWATAFAPALHAEVYVPAAG